MAKSIAIICKGPSVLESTEEFVRTFDDVAICNYPPMTGYERYIGTRAEYLFFNAHDPNPYEKDLLNSLGLREMFNTHHIPHAGHRSSFPDHEVRYHPNYGQRITEEIERNYKFSPSTGTQAFYHFVKDPEYDTIALIGFDYFKVGQQAYYFTTSEVQPSLKYLFKDSGDAPYLRDGTRVKESGHDSEKTRLFVEEMISLSGKKLIKTHLNNKK